MGAAISNITEICWWGISYTSLGECQTGIRVRSPVAGDLFATNFLSKFPLSAGLHSGASPGPVFRSAPTAKTCQLPPLFTHPGLWYPDSLMKSSFTWPAAVPRLEHTGVHIPSTPGKRLSCMCTWDFSRGDGYRWQISLAASDKFVLVPKENPFLRLKRNILQALTFAQGCLGRCEGHGHRCALCLLKRQHSCWALLSVLPALLRRKVSSGIQGICVCVW